MRISSIMPGWAMLSCFGADIQRCCERAYITFHCIIYNPTLTRRY